MKRPDLSHILADTFDTDFKAEVIAAEMIENDVPPEQIMIIMLGSLKRSFRKDVDGVTEEISDYNNKEYTHIATHKEGIYDMLPEGLFHSPTLSKSATSQREIVESIKVHKTEERNARRFFLPYEAGINHLRIQMALYENKLDKGAHHNELVNVFKGYWEIFRYLDTTQSNIFLQILPLIHDIRDDYGVAQTIFELILSMPVSIKARRQRPVKCDKSMFSNLNNAMLGVNFMTSSDVYDGGENEIIVTIGPMDSAQLSEFSGDGTNNKILERLCDYFLPVHIEIAIELELHPRDKTFRLADKESDYNSTIGLNTYL